MADLLPNLHELMPNFAQFFRIFSGRVRRPDAAADQREPGLAAAAPPPERLGLELGQQQQQPPRQVAPHERRRHRQGRQEKLRKQVG